MHKVLVIMVLHFSEGRQEKVTHTSVSNVRWCHMQRRRGYHKGRERERKCYVSLSSKGNFSDNMNFKVGSEHSECTQEIGSREAKSLLTALEEEQEASMAGAW